MVKKGWKWLSIESDWKLVLLHKTIVCYERQALCENGSMCQKFITCF